MNAGTDLARETLGRICRRSLALAGLVAPFVRQARAEASAVRIARQHGLPTLPLLVMEHERLIERHAAAAGIPGLRAEWTALDGPGAVSQAILSDQADFSAAGIPALAALWHATAATPQAVQSLSALQSMPVVLVTRNPAVRAVKDLADGSRIAVPGAVSTEAVVLGMAAAQQWGAAAYARLDPLMVAMPHPEAMGALLAGPDVDCHCTVAPFHQYELISPKLRPILNSYGTIGGPHTCATLIGTRRFRDANPAIAAAIRAAQEDANSLISRHPQQAAAMYLRMTGDTRSEVPEMARLIANPDHAWTATPAGVERLVAAMHQAGRLPRLPASWAELYMPEVQGLPGS